MNSCSISIKNGMLNGSSSLILKNPTEFCGNRFFLILLPTSGSDCSACLISFTPCLF